VDGWTALADPTRRSIFELVAAQPRAVGEIAVHVPVSRPAVSQHLKLLKSARLVLDHAEGTKRIYRVNPDGLAELRAQLDRFWNQTLTNFKTLVEEEA
jgi:DNA-binding transcriptional ArsR family regulator